MTMEPEEIKAAAEKLARSLSIDPEEKSRRLRQEGKEAARQGDLQRSLDLFLRAFDLQPSAKLKSRIQQLQEALQEVAPSQEEEEEFIDVNGSGLMLYKDLYDKLYDHQKDGVAFLYSLHRDGRRGGILADDMGLGKTIQVISFLSGMYDAELASHTLLVMPTSLIKNWVREFARWTPGMRVKEFHGSSKAERNRNLERIQRKGGVIITTYQMLINNWEQLATFQQQEFCWDYVILDEAHKIKTSSTKTAKCAHTIPARHRLLLTGTPVQNNLREMWALFDFACQGALLGTAKTFKTEYENPITRAREKDATPGEKALGLKISQNLMELIKPFFLRRTKAEVQQQKQSTKGAGEEKQGRKEEKEDKENNCLNRENPTEMPSLTRKNDLIVWTFLSPVQEDIYRQFISLDHIKALLMTSRSPLAELTVLKKLCDHPRLLSARAVTQLGLAEGSAADHVPLEDESDSATGTIDHVSDETLLEESGKLRFLVSLLERLREDSCQTLVFSQSRKMLDIIARVLQNRSFQLLRVDGTVTHLAERERRIALFQTDRRYSVFLLTTQVGGVGITLTAANRVVIFDPSWNPATDAQAVDRAYRIGQTDDVVIYRLITCGTVEEKIYRRQVFKDSLIRQTTGDKKNPFRYFSKQELKELFTLEDTHSSSTQLQLQALHSQHRHSDPTLDQHIADLYRMEMFGISDHDLLFSKEAIADEDDLQDAESDLYIQTRVKKAQELVQAESELHGQLMDSVATSTEPIRLRLAKQRGIDEPMKRPRGQHTHSSSPRAVVDLTESGSNDPGELCSNEGEIISDEEPVELKNEPAVSGQLSTSAVSSLTVGDGSSSPPMDAAASGSRFSSELQEVFLQGEDGHDPEKENLLILSPRSSAADLSEPLDALLEMEPQSISVQGELFQGEFNLQLEDSADMFLQEELDLEEQQQEELDLEEQQQEELDLEEQQQEELDLEEQQQEELDLEEQQQEEQQEGEGMFQLEMEVSGLISRENGACGFPIIPRSTPSTPADDSLLHVVRKKKKAQIICDSEEEEEQEKPLLASSPLTGSFKSLGSSTPKSVVTINAPSRRSMNTSVASRRSFVGSLLEDLEEDGDDDIIEGVGLSQASETNRISEELGEEEEPSGETLHSENFGESEEEQGEEEGEEWRSAQEESSGEVELSSSEALDQCAPSSISSGTAAQTTSFTHPTNQTPQDTFESLVHSGKHSLTEGRKQEALDFFLKAIDINSGDGEIQLLIIQLYRQLSQPR